MNGFTQGNIITNTSLELIEGLTIYRNTHLHLVVLLQVFGGQKDDILECIIATNASPHSEGYILVEDKRK